MLPTRIARLRELALTEEWGIYAAALTDMIIAARTRLCTGTVTDFPYNKGFLEGLQAAVDFMETDHARRTSG